MSRQEIEKLLDEAYQETFEECVGCGGMFPLEVMNPLNGDEWCCKHCHYLELEEVIA